MPATAKGLMCAAIAAAILALAACNPVANLNAGDSQIAKFHAAYSRGDAGAIYAMTGPQFRATTSRAQMDDLVDVFSVRLGAVRSSERTSFNVNSNPSGTFTTIIMATQFAKGQGQEDFIFSGKGDEMKLEGWHVHSPNLALTPDDIADERGEAGPAPVVLVAPPDASAAPARKAPSH
jgi:hypothetical protein